EHVLRVKNWTDGVALTTNLRHFVAGSEPAGWAVSHERWVDDVVIATRDDLIVEGQPERFGFLLVTDGRDFYLNDQAVVAELARRLSDQMNPLGFAQILVAFHPYSSAYRSALTEPDELRRVFGHQNLPDVQPIRLRRSPDGLVLTFSSFVRYLPPGGSALIDLLEWAVDVPAVGPARWSSRLAATGLRLYEPDGAMGSVVRGDGQAETQPRDDPSP